MRQKFLIYFVKLLEIIVTKYGKSFSGYGNTSTIPIPSVDSIFSQVYLSVLTHFMHKSELVGYQYWGRYMYPETFKH